MAEIGYTLSSEEFGPRELVGFARRAEETGFTFGLISDHFHPWIDRQGHSPFVWTVLGGIAQATERLRVGTGVTCPLIRMHPAIVAQAAATVADAMPGRFFLGVGTGENLNEHITGDRWPSIDERIDMLVEAVDVMRTLWQGGQQTHRGPHYTVEQATVYTLPDQPPPIYVAAAGERMTRVAADIGDGMIATSPDSDQISTYDELTGGGRPKVGQLHVCWATSEDDAKKTAFEWWPNTSIPGELGQELPLPRHFEQTAQMLAEDDVAENVPCGPDPERHLDAIREYVDAGFDHVYVHQVGPDQEGFFRFYEREVLPKIG